MRIKTLNLKKMRSPSQKIEYIRKRLGAYQEEIESMELDEREDEDKNPATKEIVRLKKMPAKGEEEARKKEYFRRDEFAEKSYHGDDKHKGENKA